MGSEPKQWGVYNLPTGVNVAPISDVKEHNLDAGCWCEPTTNKGIIVHHSLDQRERFEPKS